MRELECEDVSDKDTEVYGQFVSKRCAVSLQRRDYSTCIDVLYIYCTFE